MHHAEGVLTSRGGMTSHAAVVARGMGRCCVCGCGDITEIDEHQKFMKLGGKTFREGDYITIIGTTGEVYEGKLPLIKPDL
jgi:pyruvate,orthophosphate dikinase